MLIFRTSVLLLTIQSPAEEHQAGDTARHTLPGDKARPVLVLTREVVRPHLPMVTVAPITTTIRGLSTEVHVDVANGLSGPSVVSCDNVTTIPTDALRDQIGVLLDDQEPQLSRAVRAAFDLD